MFLAAALMLTVAVACEKEPGKENGGGTDYQELTFSATAANVAGVETGWSAGDAISIFDGKANQKFTATAAGASTSFSGTANAKADAFMAVSPYSADYKRTSGKVAVQIPASQKAVANGLDAAGAYQVAYAKTATDALSFSFMPAIVKFTVAPGNDVVAVTIAAKGEETIAGTANLTLSENPSCEAYGEGSSKVTLTGSLSGTFYAAVIPANVSGFVVSFTNTSDFRAEVEVRGAELKSGVVTDLGSFESFDWVEAANPNPTNVVGAVIMKSSFKTADFNLVSDGGFEDYPNSTWKWADPESPAPAIITGHNSDKAIRLERTHDGGNMSNLEQACKWQKGEEDTWWVIEFDARVSKDRNCDFYSGFGFFDAIGNWWKEVNGHPLVPEDVQENGRFWFNDEQWHHYKLEESCFKGQYKGTVHVGMWGNPDLGPCWSEYDNIIAYPQGYEYRNASTALASTTVLGSITNATYDQVDGAGKIVAWMDQDNKVKLAFSDVVINGNVVTSAIAETESADPTSIQISKFYKTAGVMDEILPLEGDEIGFIPDDVFVMDGKTYMHYYTTYFFDPAFTLNWKADKTGFVVSEDNGKTWTAAPKTWLGSEWANNADGKFSNAAFANHDGYTYMVGSHAGRDNWLWGQSYAARVADGEDLTDPDAYDYWTNPGWTNKGGEGALDDTCPVFQGDRGVNDLIWNPKFQVYQVFYRSDDAHGILYRDSKGPDANGNWYWSGSKLLVADSDEVGVLGSISVLKVEDDGSIVFVASNL